MEKKQTNAKKLSSVSGLLYCEELMDRKKRKGEFWFELKDDTLKYFEKARSTSSESGGGSSSSSYTITDLVGEIKISHCFFRNIALMDGKEDSDLWFEIVSDLSSDHVLLKASTVEEKNHWISSLKKHKLSYWSGKSAQPILPQLDSSESSFRGFLMKRGKRGNTWRRRWFVCNDKFIIYFKSQKDATPIGEIDIQEAKIKFSDSPDSTLKFEIQLPQRSFYLEANNREDLKRWLASIDSIIALKLSGTVPLPVDTPQSMGKAIISEKMESALRRPDKEGFLMKQGAGFKTWKRRWFVLRDLELYYFTSSQIVAGEHCGVIPLDDGQVRLPLEKGVLQFEIVTRSRVYFIRADTEEDMHTWAEAINTNKRRDKNIKPFDPSSAPLVRFLFLFFLFFLAIL